MHTQDSNCIFDLKAKINCQLKAQNMELDLEDFIVMIDGKQYDEHQTFKNLNVK